MSKKIKLTIVAALIALISAFGLDNAQAQSVRHSRHTTVRHHHRGPVRTRVVVRHRPVRRTRVVVRHRPVRRTRVIVRHHPNRRHNRVTTRTVITR